jgi:3-oxoacyl-(acyl-carrier-protein) synthase
VSEFWQSMMEGKSGAGPITYFDASKYDTKFACEVKGFDLFCHPPLYSCRARVLSTNTDAAAPRSAR